MDDMKIPFLDLSRQSRNLKGPLMEAMGRVVNRGIYFAGPETEAFEHGFQNLFGSEFQVVSTGSGTDALLASLIALGLAPGDEVIVPANAWVSCAESVIRAGGVPVFCSADPITMVAGPKEIEPCLTKKTAGVLLVHLYGQFAPAPEVRKLCRKNGLWLIEDCAQALLTKSGATMAGATGDVGIFSFYPTKILGALGNAGAVITRDPGLAEKITRIRNHGRLSDSDHDQPGFNGRMDEIQAAFLNEKLEYLNGWIERKQEIVRFYSDHLGGISAKMLLVPSVEDGAGHTFHQYVIQTEIRDQLQNFLKEKGVQTAIHYPCLIPDLPSMKNHFFSKGDWEPSRNWHNNILSLPSFPELTDDELKHIVAMISAFYRIK